METNHSMQTQMDSNHTQWPSHFSFPTELCKLQSGAFFEIKGQDVRNFLNRILTVNLKTLENNKGVFSFLLDSKGIIKEAFHLFCGTTSSASESWWVLCPPEHTDTLKTNLDFYLFGEDVQIQNAHWVGYSCQGKFAEQSAEKALE